MLVEHAVSASNRCFAISKHIVGKADSRSWIEKVALQTTSMGIAGDYSGVPGEVIGSTRPATLLKSEQRVPDSRNQCAGIPCNSTGNVQLRSVGEIGGIDGRVPVVSVMVAVAI